ncbi:Disks large 1 tumor suppressor protein [Acromyrmex echinatior]|uniref:Disks large 1 tumor suppressor protein n=1 Tax=Acromyrmex echinatior TaxID=103372 RepID=F4WKZ1_ACREC|nr:Disks large 1 tumor suppressor protein [Acromyrmex echinatior]
MSDDGVSSSANTLFTLDTPGAAGPAGSYCEVHGYVQAKEDNILHCPILVLSQDSLNPFRNIVARSKRYWQGVTGAFDPDDLHPTYPGAGDIYSRTPCRDTRWLESPLELRERHIQEFYELTLLDESKSVQQKTAETIRIADKWEASDGPITPTFAQNDVSTVIRPPFICMHLASFANCTVNFSEQIGREMRRVEPGILCLGLLLLDAPYLLTSFWTAYINTSGFYEKSSFPCAAVYFSSTIFKSAEVPPANLKSLYPRHMVGFLYSSHKLHLFGRSLPHSEHHAMTHNLSTRTRCINSDQWDDSVPPSSSALGGR